MRTDWVEVELGAILEIERGGSPRPIKDYITTAQDGINWIKIGDASLSGKYIEKVAERIKPEGLKKSRLVLEGDFLLSNSMSFGRPYILRTRGAIHDGWLVLRNKEGFCIEKDYLYYALSSPNVYVQFEKLAAGSTVKNLNIALASAAKILLPPLPEQRAIVAKIEQLFSELDNGIANLKTAQAKLDIYRQAVLKQAFEGEITKEWRERQDELPSAEALYTKISSEIKAYQEKQQSAITKRKEKKNLENLFDRSNGLRSYPSNYWLKIKAINFSPKITDGEHITPIRSESGYYLLSARNIKNGYIDYKNIDYVEKDEYERIRKRCNPEMGDILISCSGSIGRVTQVPKEDSFVMVRSVALFKTYKNLVVSKYLEYLFRSPFIQKQIEKSKKATAQANLFLAPIGNLELLICSIEEQTQIVQEIESRLSVCDNLAETIQLNLQKAEALRQSILKKAFEGRLLTEAELQACRAEADWEPAQALLAKIQASTTAPTTPKKKKTA